MFCLECGKEIPDTAKFCPDCGTAQTKKIEEAEEDLPFGEVESIEEDLPFGEVESIEEDLPFAKVEEVSEAEMANLVHKKNRFAILCWSFFVFTIIIIVTVNTWGPFLGELPTNVLWLLFMFFWLFVFASPYCFLVFVTKYFSLSREIERANMINLLHSTSEKAKIREISATLDYQFKIEMLRKKRTRALLFGTVHTIACYLVTGSLLYTIDGGDAPFFIYALFMIAFFSVVILACNAGYRVLKITYQIWKTSFSKWYGKTSNNNAVKEGSNWTVFLTLVIIIFGIIILSTGGDESSYIGSNNDYTYISASMYNNDEARHPVHVYLNGDHVYGEWVEAGELVWPTICLHRCPDGEYTVAIDWGGDATYECMVRVVINHEGDQETVACNYH